MKRGIIHLIAQYQGHKELTNNQRCPEVERVGYLWSESTVTEGVQAETRKHVARNVVEGIGKSGHTFSLLCQPQRFSGWRP